LNCYRDSYCLNLHTFEDVLTSICCMAHFYLFDHLLNFVFVFDHRTALPVTHRQSLVTQSLGLLEF